MAVEAHLVIMAGGIGSRFWPMSTPEVPKQFIDITGCGRTLIQLTADRFASLVSPENMWVVTSKRYENLVREQLPGVPPSNILLEPCMRNTAPCIAYAGWKIKTKNPDAAIVVTPSDHVVTNVSEFQRVIARSLDFVTRRPAKERRYFPSIRSGKSPPLKLRANMSPPEIISGTRVFSCGALRRSKGHTVLIVPEWPIYSTVSLRNSTHRANRRLSMKISRFAKIYRSITPLWKKRPTCMSSRPISVGPTWVPGAPFTRCCRMMIPTMPVSAMARGWSIPAIALCMSRRGNGLSCRDSTVISWPRKMEPCSSAGCKMSNT